MDNFFTGILDLYKSFTIGLPLWAQNFIGLFLLVLLVVIYAIVIWKFYRFVARRDIIKLNLNQYNTAQHPTLTKIFAAILYFIEYILVSPLVVFLAFGFFTLFLIVLTEGLEVETLLIISATIIAAIRMTSYYEEDLSKDLAKLLPFTLLAISMTKPEFFNIERILGHFSKIPEFFNNIIIYLAFIIVLEIVLRFFEFIFSLFGLEDIKKSGEEKEIVKVE